MDTFIVQGGKRLTGEISVSGAKNVALKALVASCLTSEEVVIENIPLISDLNVMVEIIEELGGSISIKDHTAIIRMEKIQKPKISLEKAAYIRTSCMFVSPLLARCKEAIIPNPGGCRIGARPIDRTVAGLEDMGADISYHSEDGYFHAKLKGKQLTGTTYRFEKNTHTGTETLLLAAVLAQGKTVLKNAASEPEVDQLINLLNAMGAQITRTQERTIEIEGVSQLHGTTFKIVPDRNEIVTLAIAAIMTEGDIFVKDAKSLDLQEFLNKLDEAGGGFEVREDGIRFFFKGPLKPTDVTTSYHPGFMTDWQGPWAVFMTKAHGKSIVHETVYENRFGYAQELKKMGAKIELFNPEIEDSRAFYNFNVDDDKEDYLHAAKITGPVQLHDGVVDITDLRAGATLILAALAAQGESIILGIEHVDRGYEMLDERLKSLGADIRREKEN